ncbi:MAG: hypothetical protein JWQ98_468 [Chlorobi bacterium]|nr:hypothetical protein [Chlorobiota bacterium]
MKATLTLMALALLLALPGCCPHGGVDPGTSQSVPQKYLFEASSLNYAWGFAHSGLSIDSAGNIYSFQWDFRGTPEWQPHQNGEYTADDLAAEYAPNRKFLRTIPRDSLERMKSLMASAQLGSYSDTTHTGADMGNEDVGFYRYDGTRGIYTWIVLRRRGDFSFDNQAASAKVIADWLQALHKEAMQ